MSRAWDGRTYDRVGTPQAEWGRAVLDRLPLRGDETVLDAGCGSGRVTEMLLDRLPAGRVIAVDGSASMAEAARERLAGRPVEVLVQDLLELDLGGERVDAVLSTATFHWIKDHERLFRRLHAALRPGGRLVAQCGGKGNLTRVLGAIEGVAARAPYVAHLTDFRDPHLFADAPETEGRLRDAGFAEAHAWLAEAPVQPPEPPVFLGSVIATAWLEHLPADLRDAFVADVLALLDDPFTADYIRLNMDATA